VRHALEAGARVEQLYAAPDLFICPQHAGLAALAERRGATVLELSGTAFLSISRGVRPDGLAALVERWPIDLGALSPPPEPLVVVAEGIERPGNLGALIRTAHAAGAKAFLACDPATDVFHPETVRGSVGALFRLPVARTTTERALAWLRSREIPVIVAAPEGALPYWQPVYSGACAAVLGSERYGVSARWLAAAESVVRIPMARGADSVNVAVAAGVVLFEAARQRGVYEATSAVETTAPLERTTPSSQRASTRPPPNCWR
jgi:RNA methyltransferase, TrmH family